MLLAQTCNVQDQWPVVAEPFSRWVIEDRFPAGRPPLAAVRHPVETYLREEAIPSLSPVAGIQYDDYARTVLERLSNSYIRDTVARLCEYSSDRLLSFVLPVLRHNIVRGATTEMSVRAIAAWRQWLAVAGSVTDHRASRLQSAARNPDPVAFVRDTELFGDLVRYRPFVEQYALACSAVGSAHA